MESLSTLKQGDVLESKLKKIRKEISSYKEAIRGGSKFSGYYQAKIVGLEAELCGAIKNDHVVLNCT